MKEIGYRFEKLNTIHIVEMTKFEFDLIEEFLTNRPDVETFFNEWCKRMRSGIQGLCLDTQLENVLVRSILMANVSPCKLAFSDDDGKLLEFEQWREILLSRLPATKREFARKYPKIGLLPGMGQRGIDDLIVKLKKSKTE